ncbi:MAG TPA: hypothetical protein P5096_03405 [Patescibacteria group bacterium]|nr:hypothetical protein [Patescibacteria group bacterium]
MEREHVIKLTDVYPERETKTDIRESLKIFFTTTRTIIDNKLKDGETNIFTLDFQESAIYLSEALAILRELAKQVRKSGGKFLMLNVDQYLIDMVEINGQEKFFKIIDKNEIDNGTRYKIEVCDGF